MGHGRIRNFGWRWRHFKIRSPHGLLTNKTNTEHVMKHLFAQAIILFIIVTSVKSQPLTRRASLGFQPMPVDSSMLADLGLEIPMGVVVTSLSEGSALLSLGVENNDVLLEINGDPTNTIPELITMNGSLRANDPMTVEVLRNGKKKTLRGKADMLPYETSPHAEVIYDHFDFRDGQIRSIIYKPKKEGKHPVIFFVPGYSCISVDNMHAIHPYQQLLDSFAAKGYVIYKMEKPGMGDNENTGDCRQLGFDQELESYMIGYDQLKKYDFVDQENIFLWGHSMGGLYAPLIAAEKQPKGVAFYGMIHDTWTEYLLRMVRYQNPRLGTADYVQTDKDVRILYGLLYEHYYLGKSSKELAAENAEYSRILARDFQFDGENQILFRHEQFWRELYDYSLTDALAKFNGFVLSMNGEADLEVVNDISQREVVHIVNHYHPGHGEFCYFPKTDHSMIKVGTLEEGAVIRFEPRYREMMANNFNFDIVDKTDQWIKAIMSK